MAIQFQGADEYKSKINVPSVPQLLENKAKITSARDEWYRRQALARGRDAAMAKLGDNYQGQIDITAVQDYLAKAGKSDLAQPIIGSYTDADVARLGKDIELQKSIAEGQMLGYIKQGQPTDRLFNPEVQKTEVSTQYGDKIVSDSATSKPITPTMATTPESTKYDFITGKSSKEEIVDDFGTEMNLGEGRVIAADEGKLPDIGPQTTVQEKIIPEQIPSISQSGRGMWKGFTAPKDETIDMNGNVSGGLWKYSLPTGEQKQFATDAAQALGLQGKDINGELDFIVTESIKMPSSAKEFLTEYSPKGIVEAQAKFLQAQREVLDKRNALKKQMAEQIAGKAQEMFGRGITKAGEIRAERKQEFDTAEFDPNTNEVIWKKISNPTTLKRIYDGLDGIDDMTEQYKNILIKPSLSNVTAFNVAKLKAEGNPITNDAVANMLIKSGYVPKAQEIKLKKVLETLNLSDLTGFGILDQLMPEFKQDINTSTFAADLKNTQKSIYRLGGKVPEYKPSAIDTFEARKTTPKENIPPTKSTPAKKKDPLNLGL